MADGLTIPGVTDKYKTNDLVEALMETERVPLKREQAKLEEYKDQQSAWRGVSQKMSTLRQSVKSLYSFENPFNNKLAESSDENALTVDAGRNADYTSFKIEILQPAAADRFLSGNIDKSMKVEAGKYTFTVGNKTVEFNWKGGKLSDFVTALNKRGNNIIKASIIGISSKKQALLIESLITGEENKLIFENKALEFAQQIDMITPTEPEVTEYVGSETKFSSPSTKDAEGTPSGLPALSAQNVKVSDGLMTIPARGGVEIPIPQSAKDGENEKITFTITLSDTEDVTVALNSRKTEPELPDPGLIDYMGIIVHNEQSETTLPDEGAVETAELSPVTDDRFVFIKNSDGSEEELGAENIRADENELHVSIALNDYPNAESIIIRNSNTGRELTMTLPKSTDMAKGPGYNPNHPIVEASDAKIKYEGITITRPTNDIDDVIPDITLHVHEKSEKPVTVKINPDTESAKTALIAFVGHYNQVIAEMNILTSNKPEIITELDYLDSDEQEAATKRLGMFQGDFSLTNGKSQLQRIVSGSYRFLDEAVVTMLNQIGISTNASSGSSGYNAAQMRGYLEIDEKKLDSELAQHLEEIKNLFGYDTDGDLIIDDGIGFLLDKQLGAWVQSGGIIATKTSSLETQIKSSNTKISNLEEKLDDKEAELRRKYSAMEGSLDSLEGQQTTITNFSNSMNNNRK